MLVKERTYEEIALAEPERKWELHRGQLREKPAVSDAHQWLKWRLIWQLVPQLDLSRFSLRGDDGRVRRIDVTYYIPDVYIAAVPGNRSLDEATHRLEVFTRPLPLVVEVWSPSTGDYDDDEKFSEYRLRGDLEIWRLHPIDRTLTAWRRQASGEYVRSEHVGGRIALLAVPGVVVDLDALFA